MTTGERTFHSRPPLALRRWARPGAWRWLPALGVVAQLAACSSEPSSADIHSALQRHFADVVAPAQKHFGPQAGSTLVPTVQAVALHGCTARDGGQYLCDAQVTLHSKVLGQRHATTRLLLAQDPQGWRVLSQL